MAEKTATPTPVPAAKADRIGEVVIEVGDDRNRRILWPITKRELRGRWDRTNLLGVTMHASMQKMPDIPGMHITLDCSRKTAKVTDPLNDPRNRELTQKIMAILKDAYRVDYGCEKDTEQTGLNASEVKTWLYWMRRLVDNNQARVLRGALPELEDIDKLEGFTMIQNFNSSSRAVKTRERQREIDEAIERGEQPEE